MEDISYDAANRGMIEKLRNLGFLKSSRIVDAFMNVPRHRFVPENLLQHAYEDQPLQIAENAAISQPATVAVMLEALAPAPGNRVLEVGTGSGWQACLLAYCVGYDGIVVTIEINKEVFRMGKKNIEESGFDNVKAVLGDGSEGYSKAAPYDIIVFTAAAPAMPNNIATQLKMGGRLLIPVSRTTFEQRLLMLTKVSSTEMDEKDLGSFMFVPLGGKGGYQ